MGGTDTPRKAGPGAGGVGRPRIGRGGKFSIGEKAGSRKWRPSGPQADAQEEREAPPVKAAPEREEAEERRRRLQQLEETKRQKAEEDQARVEARSSREADERREREEEQERKAREEAAAGQEAEKKAESSPDEPTPEAAAKAAPQPARREDAEEEAGEQPARAPKSRPRRGNRPGGSRASDRSGRKGRLTVVKALTHGSEEERQRSLAAVRRRQARERRRTARTDIERVRVVRDVQIPDAITVQDLAIRMAESGGKVVQRLIEMGHMATLNAMLDGDTAELVVREFDHRPVRVSASDVEIGLEGPSDDPASLRPRPPVVTVMGHVDHGKTSLLDAIRGTQVAAGEAGAITQHIGAYRVDTPDGSVTFIDTPGHAAFSAMRAHGARITDVVVLVVAADDGLMPQTEEAINHARAAGVPVVVAINKMDLESAEPDRVRDALLRHEVVVEARSGEVLDVEISAKTGAGIPDLLRAILLQAELMDLKVNPDRKAEGAVIEARLDRGRGPLATVLVERGTLRRGDNVVVGSEYGRVRALRNDRGETVESAGPSTPVEVDGLRGAPEAGDKLVAVQSEARAREIADYRSTTDRGARIAPAAHRQVEFMMDDGQPKAKRLNLVVKADVRGSAEAIAGAIKKLGAEDLEVEVLHSGVGAITISDVSLAASSEARVLGFNVRPDSQARAEARRLQVAITHHSVIYDLIKEVKDLGSGLLDPDIVETDMGAAEVREVFHIHRVGPIAGCRVQGGEIRRGARARVRRAGAVLHSGSVENLKHHKDEVASVSAGMECGIQIGGFSDFIAGDVIEAYETQEVARTL